MSATSFDVRIWKTETYARKSGKGYRVPWRVETKRFSRAFQTASLAESFRASLVTAARKGEAFIVESGVPLSMASQTAGPPLTWFEHAMDFMDAKWPDAAPKHRKSTANGLVTVTVALVRSDAEFSEAALLRKALRGWAFNPPARRRSPDPPEHLADAIEWIRRESLLLNDLADPDVLRRALTAIGRKLDGTVAATSTIAVKRAALSGALVLAVEQGRLPGNPLKQVKTKRQRQVTAIDVRSVANPQQATDLLDAVKHIEPSLYAYFACMYFAALRPAEARLLHDRDCMLPDSGWGQLVLAGSYQDPGSAWTDDGQPGEIRGLKHRNTKETRPVPADPQLVGALRWHIDRFGVGAGGLLFPTRIGRFGRPVSPPFGNPVSMKTVYRVWAAARSNALTEQQVASPLAARPYDLRHACVSTWLEAGVPSARVAAWAGHSVAVLHRVYAHCLDGREDEARRRVDVFRNGPSDA
ncbi:integrase [Nocardioides thalensis]|uniref:Integrase n=1 Tax=Nocardioides thalensis TaxID=1914755 RepID=A0A853BXT3_9ACTN|nr:site-specific integrase [Nocardioides thalensis]NYI99575.1 integrase [Nocardioides thalensis]